MTDIMKLADDYARAYMSFGESAARAALQSAIEALQGEVERLDRDTADLALLADQYKAERDALAAKLDELQRQEPEAYLFTDLQSGDIEVSMYEDEKPRSHWHRKSLYASPKALEPLTDERITVLWIKHRSQKFIDQFNFASVVRCAEVAHGIGGTP